MNFITENWLELLIGLMAFAKVVTNLTPTEKDNKIFGWLDTIIDAIVPNYKRRNNDSEMDRVYATKGRCKTNNRIIKGSKRTFYRH